MITAVSRPLRKAAPLPIAETTAVVAAGRNHAVAQRNLRERFGIVGIVARVGHVHRLDNGAADHDVAAPQTRFSGRATGDHAGDLQAVGGAEFRGSGRWYSSVDNRGG